MNELFIAAWRTAKNSQEYRHVEIGVHWNHHALLKRFDQAREEPAVAVLITHFVYFLNVDYLHLQTHLTCEVTFKDFPSARLNCSVPPSAWEKERIERRKKRGGSANIPPAPALESRNSIGQHSRCKNNRQSEKSVQVNACGDRDWSRYWPLGVTLALEHPQLSREVIETSNPAEQHPLCKERQREVPLAEHYGEVSIWEGKKKTLWQWRSGNMRSCGSSDSSADCCALSRYVNSPQKMPVWPATRACGQRNQQDFFLLVLHRVLRWCGDHEGDAGNKTKWKKT